MADTRTVNIEVFGSNTGPFGVLTDHRPDLPTFNDRLQNWVKREFSDMDEGDMDKHAGEMVYTPHGRIVEFRKK